jgi:hypothetical protein
MALHMVVGSRDVGTAEVSRVVVARSHALGLMLSTLSINRHARHKTSLHTAEQAAEARAVPRCLRHFLRVNPRYPPRLTRDIARL